MLRKGKFLPKEPPMIPFIRGKVTHQAHVGVPDGTYEEEFAREGFFGRYAHLYRAHPPVDWTQIEGSLKPRAYDLNKNSKMGGDFLAQREMLLLNEDAEIAQIKLTETMPYFYRNADGDDLYFVHAGTGKLETDFGPLKYVAGDYIVVPRGTVHRWVIDTSSDLLNVTTFGELRFPDKGMLGQHALIDPAMIRVPTPEPDLTAQKCELRIRRCGEITRVTYPHSPIDALGWKGTLTVWQINVQDIRPIVCERYHLPPSAHTTFLASGVAICSFLPRLLENGDPEAMKVPFFHSNIDYDEVLFYHSGQFFSRAGIDAGMLTFHPQGIHHGPQANAVARSKRVERTNEVAVMIDTRRPLRIAESAKKFETENYWKSWMTKE